MQVIIQDFHLKNYHHQESSPKRWDQYCAYSELEHNIRKKTELRILRHISSLTQDVAIDSRCMMLTLVITLKTSSGVRAKSQQQMKQCIQVQLQNTNTLRTHCTQYSSRCPVWPFSGCPSPGHSLWSLQICECVCARRFYQFLDCSIKASTLHE